VGTSCLSPRFGRSWTLRAGAPGAPSDLLAPPWRFVACGGPARSRHDHVDDG
jgi:hypothetical protein